MIQLVVRFTSTTSTSATASIVSSSWVDGYNLFSLLTIVVKLVGTIMKALIVEPSLDMSWIVDFRASKHMTSYPHNV
jgi:hypothetical protein